MHFYCLQYLMNHIFQTSALVVRDESYHPPRFMRRKNIKEVKVNEGGHGKPWAVISLTLWLSSWKEKSTSGKSFHVVFLYSISDNTRSKNDCRLERYKSGWMYINCYM